MPIPILMMGKKANLGGAGEDEAVNGLRVHRREAKVG